MLAERGGADGRAAITGRSLVELVRRRAEESPEVEFLVDEQGRALDFAEYRRRAERVAAGLRRLGITAGTPVSWMLPTWLEATVLVGALARLQAVQNPIIPIYRQREVEFITRQTGARFLIVPGEWRGFDYTAMANAIAAGQADLEVLTVERGAALPEDDPDALPPADPDGEAPASWIFYTSGTTGDPKGARHTDATLIAAATASGGALEVTADDTSPMVFPFTHIGGLIGLCQSFLVGSRTVLVEAFDPATVLDVFRRERITLGAAGTPFHLFYLSQHRQLGDEGLFSSVRAFPGGGAPKPPQLHYDIKREIGGVGVVSGYGLTEAPILTMNTVRDPDEKLAETEGRPRPGVELKIVALDGNVAGPGQEGEIRAKAPQLMKGYVDAELDREAFDEAGFFRTGDLGYLDDDGYIVITGRLKDIIIRKGENISAKEVEDLLYTHPKVADAAVIGVPDPELGERCCAVVACADRADPLGFDEMVDFLRGERMMVQKIPEQLEIVDAMPRNPSGKILKQTLREQFAETTGA